MTLFLSLLNQGVILRSDGYGYLKAIIIRSSLYPSVLSFYHVFFKPGVYQPLVFAQLLLGFYAAGYASKKLQTFFLFDDAIRYTCSLIFLTPYFFGDYRFGNTIMSEAITYPLYLIAFSLLLKGLLQHETKAILKFTGILMILMLARRQFLFVYPAFAVILTYFALFKRTKLPLSLIVGVFLISIIATNLIERSYQYLMHDHFETIPFTGFQLTVAPLYVSKPSDAIHFSDPKVRALFSEIHAKLEKKNATLHSLKPNKVEVDHFYHHFAGVYNTICWGTVKTTLAEHGISDWYEIDKITLEMAKTLIQLHPKEWFKLYFSSVKFKMGGYYYLFFLSAVLILSFFKSIHSKDKLSLSLFVVSLFTFANYTAVALVEPINRRYACYTETMQICMFLICIALLLKHSKMDKN